MATFVHLTPESQVARIRRNGIARRRRTTRNAVYPRGVFAVPVTRSFFASHQWLRELKRRGQGPISAVYFRVPDDQVVWVGHYGGGHREMTAAEAVATFLGSERREGWEVVIPRRIEAAEISRTRALPQVIGWRYVPGAHGRRPCPCSYCTGGTFGAARIRQRFGGSV